MKNTRLSLVVLAVFVLVAAACSDDGGDGPLTLYSGRSEDLIQPLIDDFIGTTGIEVEVRYGDSAELAATILEEGDNSPADVVFTQDPASIGVVANEGLLRELGGDLVEPVAQRFRDPGNLWVGVSGRARTVVYDTTKVDPATLPATEDGFTDPAWAGRVGIAPTNGSFLSFVAAKILLDGEDATRTWLQGMAANGQPAYAKNSVIVEAVDGGEVETGLVNHYYLFRRIAEVGDVNAANHFLTGGAGTLVMPAGVGILDSTDQPDDAVALIEFLLDADAQRYFAEETFEYPLAAGVAANSELPPLESISSLDIDLSALATVLDKATELVTEAGL
jgi:iron(III) transport system substrate-binding protein